MAARSALFLCLISILCCNVQSASLVERSYEYFMSLGKTLGPNLMSLLDCMAEENVWNCAKEKAGKVLDNWDDEVQKQRRSWQDAADAEAQSSGRSLEEMPSKIGKEVEESLFSIANIVQEGVARAMGRKHESGGIDSITISAGGDKKKMKKKKPPKIHLVHPVMMPAMSKEKGRGFGKIQSWVVGEAPASTLESARFEQKTPISSQHLSRVLPNADFDSLKSDSLAFSSEQRLNLEHSSRNFHTDSAKAFDSVEHDDGSDSSIDDIMSIGRGMLSDAWALGEKALDAVAEHAIESDDTENGIEDKSSFTEQRGKKKKKKKAILKLLILGAVLKAKIGTLLQILSFKLQVKFFIIALIGLGINLARFWVDLKKKHDQPQKVIYYEHAQHQHHYDHEEDHGWGPWSRSIDPTEETAAEVDVENIPYRAYDRNSQIRPLLTRV